MPAGGRIRCILRRIFRREATEQELDAEMRAYLELLTAEKMQQGMPRGAAERAARIELGGIEQVKEEVRAVRAGLWLENFWQDLRFATRAFRRSPVFSLAAVITVAVGIGGFTALFTVVRSVLLKPLPFKEPDRLIRLYEHSADDKFPYSVVSGGVFAEWKKQSHDLSDLAILSSWPAYSLSGAGGQLPEKVQAAESSWTLFPALGVEPALGRRFTEEDDRPSANGTVILSWGLWKRRFGGDPATLNQTIRLDARTYTVIGIMPAWFAYPEPSVQLWIPIYHEEAAEVMQALDQHEFIAVARLRPGVSRAEATAELSVIVRQLHDEHRDNPFVSKGANSRPLLDDMVGDVKTPLYVLLGATICIFLIAGLNVAGLLVAREAGRRKELALRLALGGSPWRLLRAHLTESLMLSAAGGAVGVSLGYAAIQWFVATRQDMSRVEAIQMDAVVAAFTAGLVFLCALFIGTISSLSIERGHMLSSLQESSRSQSAAHSPVTLRQRLLALEVGLTVVLLIAAGLLLKSYQRLRSSDMGCLTDNVLTMRMNLPDAKYGQPAQRVTFFDALLERVRALPGAEAATLVRAVPGQGYHGDSGFAIVEHPPLPVGVEQYAITRWADPTYFAALGIPILRGDSFDAKQRLNQADEVIISESFAREYFGEEDPIGKHLLTLGHRSYRITGVVGDTRYLISRPPRPIMYFPVDSGEFGSATLVVRSSREVTSLALPIRRIVQQLDPELAVFDILTMNQILGKSTLDASFDATLVLAFAGLSLALAVVGLFGVLSYIVTQRTKEIGIRAALGAQRIEVMRLMLVDGLQPAGTGLLLGLAAGVAAGKVIRAMLFGVQPLDPGVFAAVTLILLGVAGAACLLPAWRASRLDPMIALRHE